MRLAVALLGWTLFVFAHRYRLTAGPLAAGAVLLAFVSRPAIGRGAARPLDVALLLTLVVIAVQLVPLPGVWREQLAPGAIAWERATRMGPMPASARPLSLDPPATLFALAAVATTMLLFWSMRTLFESGGIRSTIRSVAWLGLLVSPLAIVHHLLPLPIVDAFWGTTPRGLRPYGPFVNRNDFAAWLIMAIPLVLGYALARTESRRVASSLDQRSHDQRAAGGVDQHVAFDSTSVWLGLVLALMLGGLLASASRSGLAGALVGLAFFGWCARGRLPAARAAWWTASLAVVGAIAVLFADIDVLALRLEASVSEGLTGRVSIWRQTLPMIRDFWPLGSGVGTYQMVMVSYQTLSRLFYISHADNELLQMLAEGGPMLAATALAAMGAGFVLSVRRANADPAPVFWLRTGALAGVLALVAQNMVEMTLRVPANAALCAVVAAIAVHRSQADKSARTASQTAGSLEKLRG